MAIIYYRWAYSPTTGDATIAHNHEGHPTDIRFHSDLAEERPEGDLLFGFANKTDSGWAIRDSDSRPVDDPHLIEAVERAIERDEHRHASDHRENDEGIDQARSGERDDSAVSDDGIGWV